MRWDDRIEVWRQPDGYWRWEYVRPAHGSFPEVRLLANMAYAEREEACHSAATSYAGVPIQDAPHRSRRTGRGVARRAARAALLLAVAVTVWRLQRLLFRRAVRRAAGAPARRRGGPAGRAGGSAGACAARRADRR